MSLLFNLMHPCKKKKKKSWPHTFKRLCNFIKLCNMMPHFIKKLWQQPDLSRKLLSGAVSCNVNGLILKTNNPNVFYSCTYLNLSFPFLTNKSWPKIMVSLFCTYCTWTTSDGLDDCWVCVVSVVTWLQPFCVFLCCFSVSSYDDLIYWYERWTSC